MVVLIVAIGLYPKPLFDLVEPSVDRVLVEAGARELAGLATATGGPAVILAPADARRSSAQLPVPEIAWSASRPSSRRPSPRWCCCSSPIAGTAASSWSVGARRCCSASARARG
jgi:hypothetical protein